MRKKTLGFSLVLFFICPYMLFCQPTIKTINPQYFQLDPSQISQKPSVNFYKGEWVNGSLVYRFQNKVLKILSNLPNFTKNALNITLGCDSSGRYWAINPSSGKSEMNGILYDDSENRVLYQENGFFIVSPDGNTLVVDTGEDEGGTYPASSVYQIPSMQEIVAAKDGFTFQRFIGDRYVLGIFPNKEIKVNGFKEHQAEMVDLVTKALLYSDTNFSNIPPRPEFFIKIPGREEVLVSVHEKGSNSIVLKSFPSFETIENIPELNGGIPFTNSDGSIFGSIDSYEVDFLNMQTKDVKSFSFSQVGDDVFLEMGRKQRPQTIIQVGGKMEIKIVWDNEIKQWTDLSQAKTFSNKDHQYGADKTRQKGSNGELFGHDFQIHAKQVVWDPAKQGFWVLFEKTYYKNEHPGRKSSLIFVDKNFEVKSVNTYPQCLVSDFWLDPETGTPMAVDEKHRKFKLNQE